MRSPSSLDLPLEWGLPALPWSIPLIPRTCVGPRAGDGHRFPSAQAAALLCRAQTLMALSGTQLVLPSPATTAGCSVPCSISGCILFLSSKGRARVFAGCKTFRHSCEFFLLQSFFCCCLFLLLFFFKQYVGVPCEIAFT